MTHLAALRALASTPDGREKVKAAALALSILGGRPWSQFFPDEIEDLYRHAVEGEPLPRTWPMATEAFIDERCVETGL